MPTPYFSVAQPVFGPPMRFIQYISIGNVAVVTTTIPHGYNANATVRINIPENLGFGMWQINKLIVPIVSIISTTTFSIPVDTTLFEPLFDWVGSGYPAYPQAPNCTPIGELAVTNTFISSVQNLLPSGLPSN